MTNLDSLLKSRDITLPTKVCLVKATIFPVVMYGCESWTIKKAKHWRIDAFELWCWRRLLRVPWTAKSPPSRKSVLNIHWTEWCWSWNSNTLATWCRELTHLKRPWCWERLRAGGEGDDRGWDGWMASLIQWAWVWASSGSWWWTGRPDVLQSMGSQRVGQDWAIELIPTSVKCLYVFIGKALLVFLLYPTSTVLTLSQFTTPLTLNLMEKNTLFPLYLHSQHFDQRCMCFSSTPSSSQFLPTPAGCLQFNSVLTLLTCR